jgi:hypothetical protein
VETKITTNSNQIKTEDSWNVIYTDVRQMEYVYTVCCYFLSFYYRSTTEVQTNIFIRKKVSICFTIIRGRDNERQESCSDSKSNLYLLFIDNI